MHFAQLYDRVETDPATTAALDSSPLPGIWVNSNPDTNGIARMAVSESDGSLFIQAYAIGPDGLIDWGKTELAIFASTPGARMAAGFTCRYDFGFAETGLQGMLMKGLLVLSQFHRFKDDSKRADYFLREYFALKHGRF